MERGELIDITPKGAKMRKLDLGIGDLVEIDGRRYEVMLDRMGDPTLEPSITPMSELHKERGTRPASEGDFKRLTADLPSDGEE